MNNDYSEKTCDEVVEILDHIPKKMYDKMPREVINYFYQNSSDRTEKNFVYNVALPLDKQDVSDETKEIIRFFMKTFWQEDLAS